MNKEPVKEKSFFDKVKESSFTAFVSIGIIIVIFLLIWIPFKVIPSIFSNGSNYVATTLSSLIIPNDATSTNSSNPTTKNTTNDSQTKNVTTSLAPAEVSYYGKPDLEISLIGTGIIDPASKQFITTNYAGFNDEIAIKFQVKNIGTNITGPWQLRINTPSRTTPYYDAPTQVSIKPGDRIVYTTTFDSPTSIGLNNAYITVDPLNNVDEISESNNQLIVPLNIQGTSYFYNNNYNYGNNIAVPNLPYGSLYTWVNVNVNCYVNPQTSYVGAPVTWYASVTGGNGYYTYSWTGTDSLFANENMVSKTYYSSGTKMAYLTVTSNGQSVTKQCSAYIY